MPDRDEESEEPAEPEGDPAEEPELEDVEAPEREDDDLVEDDAEPETAAENDEAAADDDEALDAERADDLGAGVDADEVPSEEEPEPEPEGDPAEEPASEEPASDDSAPVEPEHDDVSGGDDEPAAVSRTEAARRRVSRAFTRPRRTQVMVAVLLGALGFAAVTQVRVNDPEGNYSALRQQELIDVLDGLAGARQRAQTEIEQLEEARDDLLDDSSQRRAALEQAQSDVENLNILAGLVPVTGPGIRVTVTEETGAVQLDSMLDVIQELRTADAEAIQLNGEVRVVADTSFEQTTGGFLVDDQLVEPPYLIEAIGETPALAGAMDTQVGAGAGLRDDGAEVEIEKLNSLDITSVHEPEDPRYAVPEEDQ